MAVSSRGATNRDIPLTPEEKIQQLGRAIYQYEQIINSAKPGSKEFKDAEAALAKLRKDFDAANKEADAKRAAAKAEKAGKTVKQLEDDLARAQALGKDTTKIKAELDKAKSQAENATPTSVDPRAASGYLNPKAAGNQMAAPKAGQKPKTGGKITSGDKGATPGMSDADEEALALDVAAGEFDLPETLFKNIPSLNNLLKRYVDENWTPAKLRKEIRNDVWFRQNSAEIKQRYVQYYNFRDMQASGQAKGTTDYEKQIDQLTRQLEDKARAMGSGAASDPGSLRRAAENMYLANQGIDDPMTNDFLAAAIRPMTGMIGGQITAGYTGKALTDYQNLQAIAKKNGFKINEIVPGAANEAEVLQGIATGKLDINRISQDARKLAAQGQPQYVRDLLGQGYDLEEIYSPYRTTMASVLEIDPNQIDLNDQTLRSAITDKGDMNMYDFKRQLKQDSRWQYTENAKKDVSNAAMKVLRDFGFQG